MLQELQERGTSAACAAGVCREVNVGETERTFSILGGAALVLGGVLRGRLAGTASAIVGGCLLYRGLTGHCSVYESLGVSTAKSLRS